MYRTLGHLELIGTSSSDSGTKDVETKESRRRKRSIMLCLILAFQIVIFCSFIGMGIFINYEMKIMREVKPLFQIAYDLKPFMETVVTFINTTQYNLETLIGCSSVFCRDSTSKM